MYRGSIAVSTDYKYVDSLQKVSQTFLCTVSPPSQVFLEVVIIQCYWRQDPNGRVDGLHHVSQLPEETTVGLPSQLDGEVRTSLARQRQGKQIRE